MSIISPSVDQSLRPPSAARAPDRENADLVSDLVIAGAPPVPPPGEAVWRRRQPQILFGLDFVAAAIAVSIALLIRFDSPSRGYVMITLAFPFTWVAAVGLNRAYETRYLGSGSEEFRRVGLGGLHLFALVAAVAYADRLEPARAYVFTTFPIAMALTFAGRIAARTKLRSARRSGRWQHRVVAVGSEGSVSDMIAQMAREPEAGLVVVGACVDDAGAAFIGNVPVLGDESSASSVLASVGADTVAVTAWSRMGQSRMRRLAWALEGSGVDLVIAPSLADVAGPRTHIRPVAGLPLIHIEQPEFTGMRRIAKGAMDRIGALLALIVLSPVLIGIAVVVRMTSPGPAIFKQIRAGGKGTTFRMWKFRSMREHAERELSGLAEANERAEGLLFKIKADPRVTPVGRCLRRSSLDELPQLVNVLRGQMSLVGPRPPLPEEVAGYETHVHRRLLVKPGMTGLWQVSGRSDLTWDESVQIDLLYVENWTFMLDLQILARTVLTVVSNRGAY